MRFPIGQWRQAQMLKTVEPNGSLPQTQHSRVVRDNTWLKTELERVWQKHFWDVPRANPIDIAFGPVWSTRLGLITLGAETRTSYIRLNALFRVLGAPGFTIIITLAHELAHYAHGFGSDLPRKYTHPHERGVVNRELQERGLGHLLASYQEWCTGHWDSFYKAHAGIFANGHTNGQWAI